MKTVRLAALILGFAVICSPAGETALQAPSAPAGAPALETEERPPRADPAGVPERAAPAVGILAQESSATPVAEAGAVRPNVLLVTLDSVRADRVGTAGGRARTPSLDRLATEGTRFANAYAQLPQTTPSHAALFTGQYPSSNGVRIAHHDALADGAVTLAGSLARAGYRTAGFYSWAGPPNGFDQGFQTYRLVGELDAADGRADATTDAALAWLDAASGDRAAPFFLWVHYRDPHYPYEPPAPYDALYAPKCDGCVDGSLRTLNRLHEGWRPSPAELDRILAAYDGEITFTDSQVGRLLGRLDALGLAENTVVVVTADHGEAFGEHGEWFHGLTAYQPTVHVPLIARWPGVLPAGALVDPAAQVIDIMPTILDLAGVESPPSVEGRTLRPRSGLSPAGDRVAITETSDWHYVAVTDGQWKLIRDNASGGDALYHLATDAGETRNRLTTDPGPAARLAAVLDEWLATRAAGTLWHGPGQAR